jgi:hypothetical protein
MKGWIGDIAYITWEAWLSSRTGEKCRLWFRDGILAENAFGTNKPYVMYKNQTIKLGKEYLDKVIWSNQERRVEDLKMEANWFIVRRISVSCSTFSF